MFRASCTVDGEWDGGAVEPYGDLRVSPAAAVLNYGRIWQISPTTSCDAF